MMHAAISSTPGTVTRFTRLNYLIGIGSADCHAHLPFLFLFLSEYICPGAVRLKSTLPIIILNRHHLSHLGLLSTAATLRSPIGAHAQQTTYRAFGLRWLISTKISFLCLVCPRRLTFLTSSYNLCTEYVEGKSQYALNRTISGHHDGLTSFGSMHLTLREAYGGNGKSRSIHDAPANSMAMVSVSAPIHLEAVMPTCPPRPRPLSTSCSPG